METEPHPPLIFLGASVTGGLIVMDARLLWHSRLCIAYTSLKGLARAGLGSNMDRKAQCFLKVSR